MIQHNKPTLGKEEEEAALRVIRSGWLAQCHQVNAFEDEFCQFLNLTQGHAVAVSTVSLPVCPSLTNSEIDIISEGVTKI